MYIYFYFRNPYGINCLAPYGGPVEPNVALGGFSKIGNDPNFNTAYGVSLTILVNNENNPDNLTQALSWEKK